MFASLYEAVAPTEFFFGPELAAATRQKGWARLPEWTGVWSKRLPLSAIRVRKFTTSTAFATRAHQVPGFVAPVSLADGMARTLDAEFLHPEATRPIFYTE